MGIRVSDVGRFMRDCARIPQNLCPVSGTAYSVISMPFAKAQAQK